MNSRTEVFTLPTGRRIGFSEHGDPSGRPVFLLHGLPGARFQHHPDTAIATRLGARVIMAERPGYGLSDAQPGRTIADGCDDLAALADYLGIRRFAVAGYSLGGLYALACAHMLRERVQRVALIASLAPLDAPDAAAGLLPASRASFDLARANPQALPAALQPLTASPDIMFQAYLQMVSETDQQVMNDPPVTGALRRDLAAVLQQGTEGFVSDLLAAVRPWEFSLADIDTEVHLWHGERDITVTPAIGRYLATALPNCTTHVCRDDGHLLLFARWEEIILALVQGRPPQEDFIMNDSKAP